MAAYATAPVGGIGNLQPMLRFQMATGENDFQALAIDAQLGLLMKQQKLRVLANFQHVAIDPGDLSGNKLQLAVQAQF